MFILPKSNIVTQEVGYIKSITYSYFVNGNINIYRYICYSYNSCRRTLSILNNRIDSTICYE